MCPRAGGGAHGAPLGDGEGGSAVAPVCFYAKYAFCIVFAREMRRFLSLAAKYAAFNICARFMRECANGQERRAGGDFPLRTKEKD